jgi:hypothetical protein
MALHGADALPVSVTPYRDASDLSPIAGNNVCARRRDAAAETGPRPRS